MWFLGALLGIGSELTLLVRILLQPWLSRILPEAESTLQRLASGTYMPAITFEQWGIGVVSVSLLLMLLFLLLWLVVTWADGTIITAVSTPQTLTQSMRAGLRLLGRFVAIDALVFLPWFVVSLIIMLIFGAAVIGAGLVSVQGEMNTAVTLLFIGLACIIPLSCLLIPLTFLSTIYRLFAFRDAALHDHTPRRAIRHTWQVLRSQLGSVIILIVIVSGGSSLVNVVLNWVSVPLAALMAVPQQAGLLTLSGIAAVLILCAILLLVLLLNAMLHALTAVIWTLGYQQMIEE